MSENVSTTLIPVRRQSAYGVQLAAPPLVSHTPDMPLSVATHALPPNRPHCPVICGLHAAPAETIAAHVGVKGFDKSQ